MKLEFFSQWNRKEYYNFDFLNIGFYKTQHIFDFNIIIFGIGIDFCNEVRKAPQPKNRPSAKEALKRLRLRN